MIKGNFGCTTRGRNVIPKVNKDLPFRDYPIFTENHYHHSLLKAGMIQDPVKRDEVIELIRKKREEYVKRYGK